MKIIKTVVLAMAVAMAVLCNSQAMAYTNTVIGIVTNYSTMTISFTIKTNLVTVTANGTNRQVVSSKMVTKDVLNLLAGPDFANTTWPAGAKLVMGWDLPWSGGVLVVDTTGTNVLYDAGTPSAANALSPGGNYISLDPFYEKGPKSGTSVSQSTSYTWYNNANFHLTDYTTPHTFLHGTGSCTEKFSQKWDASGNPTTWSDTENYSQNESDQILLGSSSAAIASGTITLSGKGSGSPWYLANP